VSVPLLCCAVAFALLLYAAVWSLCVRINNYGYLDVVWSGSVGMLAAIYALAGTGDPWRRVAFTAVALLWSLRLGVYIFLRVTRRHPQEDPRYRTLRQQWPGKWWFLAFFELQACVALVFAMPFLLAAINGKPGLGGLEILGLSLSTAAIAAEGYADWQAQRFKRNPANRGLILDVGLWRYSRHPNYFFESLTWWGFFLAALDSPWGVVTIICPLLMLYFLLRVTGIPLTEKHSLETHGEAYRRYQRRTSPLIPWFVRH
jgi:steroid 5-alpha reductase family enzyme